jgi:predicted lipoprotein
MTALLQTEAGYTQLVSVRDQMNALFELLEASLKNTDLYLGFNSLDGD